MERARPRRTSKIWVLGIAMASLWALGAGADFGRGMAYAQPKPEPQFVLYGIVLGDGGPARILLGEPQWTQGRPAVFGVGDMVGPYRVVSIGADYTILEQPGEPPLRVELSGADSSGGLALTPPPQKSGVPSPPSDTGKAVYRPAWEGPSTPGPRPPAFDAEDFKRQFQQHLKGPISR